MLAAQAQLLMVSNAMRMAMFVRGHIGSSGSQGEDGRLPALGQSAPGKLLHAGAHLCAKPRTSMRQAHQPGGLQSCSWCTPESHHF